MPQLPCSVNLSHPTGSISSRWRTGAARTGGRCLAKKISLQDNIGDAGIALIHGRVAAMGHVWHERKTDAGIDGEIELRNAATGEVRNHILLVQSKASETDFSGETDDSFHYVVKERDLEYWLSGNVPVILVCSHPGRNEAWWVHINDYFDDAHRRDARRIDFDKHSQSFDTRAAHALARLAAPAGSGVYIGPEPRPENLTSNLLPLEHPATTFWAPCEASDIKILGQALRDRGLYRRNWVLRGGHLYSFQPFREKAWDPHLAGPVLTTPTADYLVAVDPADQRLAVQMLNMALQDAFHRDLAWHRQKRFLYFKAPEDLSARKAPGRGWRDRTVFKAYNKKNDPTQVAYYRHDAVEVAWITDDNRWYVQLTPTYHFTIDGHGDYPFADSQLAGIKRIEKAGAVEGSLRMWAGYLRGDKPQLGDNPRVLHFGDLLTFDAEQGIDDSTWTTSRQKQEAEDRATEAIDLPEFDLGGDEDDWDGQGSLFA
jgi:hypothetical protein